MKSDLSFSPRRKLLLGLIGLASLPSLQGCLPLAATGATSAALMVADRRTSGTYIEDEGIEWRTRNTIKQRFGNGVNISVTSYNRNVLLTGQVPDEATHNEIARLASNENNVRGIINELVVSGNSPLSSRGNDAAITSMVKARFVDNSNFSANHVKVITEWNTVYLLGLVTHQEADAATEVARNTRGVAKVVRVFEYIKPEEARQLDHRNKNKQAER